MIETVRGAGYRLTRAGRAPGRAARPALSRLPRRACAWSRSLLVPGASPARLVGGLLAGARAGGWSLALAPSLAGRCSTPARGCAAAALAARRAERRRRRDGAASGASSADRVARALRAREQRPRERRAPAAGVPGARSQASPNGVVLLDAQGRIEWCNQTAADALRARSRSATCCSTSTTWCATRRSSPTCRPAATTSRRDRGAAARAAPAQAVGAAASLRRRPQLLLSRDVTARSRPRRCGATSSPTSRTRSARR